MIQNVTLRMDSDVMRKLKHRAVDEQTSLSSWIADKLALIIDQDEALIAVTEIGDFCKADKGERHAFDRLLSVI